MQIITVGWNPAVDRIVRSDQIFPDTHQKVQLVARLAAGKAANVSRALALLGVDSIAMGIVGRGEADLFSSQLEALGPGKIQCQWILTDQNTRENITLLSRQDPHETHLRQDGFHLADAEIAALEGQLFSQTRSNDVVIFAGALPDGLSVRRHASIVDRLNKSGIRVVIDTSGDALRHAFSQPLWLIKPNLEELSEALRQNIPNDPRAIVAALEAANAQPENILVSRGADGAVLVSRTGHWTGSLKSPGPIVRTVGCGDHLLAGFVASAIKGASGPKSLTAALAVASLRAISPDPGFFDASQVGRLSQITEIILL